MSTRANLAPQPVIVNASMATSQSSAVTILANLTKASYGVSWTGTSPVGTLSVQASNDYSLYPNGKVNNPGTWTTLTLSVAGAPVTTISVSGNTGTAMIDIVETSIYAIQLVYTAASGTGTLNAILTGKVA